MNNELLVEKIVQSLLSLQVEAVQNDTVEVTGTMRGTPVKVKVKVRKKDKAGVYHNAISIPTRNHSSNATEKIRLVSSDQTIMSFDMIMDTDQTLPNKKHRNKFLELFRPGICLGNANDDKESYQPSKQKKYSISSKSDDVLKKHFTLSKNDYFDISTIVPKGHQNFFGKCKPGGCLDPPFGEDNYSYAPVKRQLQLETSPFTTKSLDLEEDVRNLNRISLNKSKSLKNNLSHPSNITDLKQVQDQPPTNSLLNLYQAESVNTSLSMTYSHSIITYPPPLTPSEIRLNNEKNIQQRMSTDNKLRKSFNEFSQNFFIAPKEITNQIDHKNYNQEILRSNDENNFIQPAFDFKSETSSGIPDLSSNVLSNKNIVDVTQVISGVTISPTKQIKEFNNLSNTNPKATPSVDDIIGKNEEALIHYAHKGITILPCKNDHNNELVYEVVPTDSSISLKIHSKSASLTIKSRDTILKPSIQSSLAETNLNISKAVTEKLSQHGFILNKTLPPSLRDNKIVDKRISNQIQKSISDPKNLHKTTECYDDRIVSKEDIQDNLSKILPYQWPQQENLLLSKALISPLSLEVCDKSSEKNLSVQDRISKNNSSILHVVDKLDYGVITRKLDKNLSNNYVNDGHNAELKDETKNQILRTGLDSEVNKLLEKAVNETKEKSSFVNNSVTMEIINYARDLKDADDLKHSKRDYTERIPTKSKNELVSETKKQQSDLFFESAKEYLSSKVEEQLSRTLIETSLYLNPVDYTGKHVSKENNLIGDKTDNKKIVQSNLNLKRLSDEISKYDSVYAVENQERSHSDDVTSKSDVFTDLESLNDIRNKTLTISQAAKHAISDIYSINNYEANETNDEKTQMDKYVSEDITQIKSDVKKEFNEIVKECSFQVLENTYTDVSNENINSIKELTVYQPQNWVYNNEKQFKNSVIAQNKTNIEIDKSPICLLDDKSKTLQIINAKAETFDWNPTVTTANISGMFPNQYDVQVNMEIESDNRINDIKSTDTMASQAYLEETDQITTDELINVSYNGLINNDDIQDLSFSISPEKNFKEKLELQSTCIPLYSSIQKGKQNDIVDNLDDIRDVSNLEIPRTEKLSTIFDVIEIPDPTKLKRNITALKSRAVLYIPSENTLSKAISKETVAVDLAFHSYINEERKIFLKTFDSENEPQRYSDDRVVIIKSDINLYNNEMKIPIDSENSLFLQIKKVNKNDYIEQNVLKDPENVHHTKMVSNKLQIIKSHDVKAPNLNYIYEKNFLPLQNAIKDLKDEIEDLASHSSILKDKLVTRKSKPLRLTNVNKRCVCLKRLF